MSHSSMTACRHCLQLFVKKCSPESSQGGLKAWAPSVMTRSNQLWIRLSAYPSAMSFPSYRIPQNSRTVCEQQNRSLHHRPPLRKIRVSWTPLLAQPLLPLQNTPRHRCLSQDPLRHPHGLPPLLDRCILPRSANVWSKPSAGWRSPRLRNWPIC